MLCVTTKNTITGLRSGIVIFVRTCSRFAPSIFEASRYSLGIVYSPARKMTTQYPRLTQTVVTTIAIRA